MCCEETAQSLHPFILPVSALITDSTIERANYDRALEVFSKPLMNRFADASAFRREPSLERDGVLSNFDFSAYQEALPAWRFIDLTSHVEYLSGVIDAPFGRKCIAKLRSSARVTTRGNC